MCGTAEKAGDVAGSVARIERVENSSVQAGTATEEKPPNQNSSSPNQHPSTETPANQQPLSKESPSEKQSDSLPATLVEMQEPTTNEKIKIGEETKDDNDSAMDTTEPTNPSTPSNGKLNNGHATPNSESLGSPPLCNGNHSDNDSLLTESNSKVSDKLVNGTANSPDIADIVARKKIDTKAGGDTIANSKIFPINGCINGLEKMLQNIADKTIKEDSFPSSDRLNNGKGAFIT